MKQLYGIDMEERQRPKLTGELPAVDVVVTMGCNVQCPYIPASLREDWGLEDPSGQPDEAFIRTAREIERRVKQLKDRLKERGA